MGDVIVQPSNDSEAIRVLQERFKVIQQRVQLSNAPCTAVALERALQAKRERLAQSVHGRQRTCLSRMVVGCWSTIQLGRT